jgi:uncharacterized protein YjbI with pentapeptide repeats
VNQVRQELEQAVRRGDTASRVDARGADLSGARLARLRADFVRFDGADLTGAQLSRSSMADCDLVGATLVDVEMNDSKLWQTFFRTAVADRINLAGTDFTGCSLAGARLAGARLDGARLDDTDLRGADLTGANLRTLHGPGVDLRDANLGGADLTGADLSGADLRGCRLDGAVFAGAILTGARFDGAAPDVGTVAYSREGLLEVLDAADPDAARRWWRQRPDGYYRFGADLNLAARMAPIERAITVHRPTVVALLDEMLGDDDRVAVHEAARNLHLLAAAGWDVSAAVPSLALLLGSARGPAIPGGTGRWGSTADGGRFAAYTLGALAADGDRAARTALDAAMDGRADHQRHAALGLAVAHARRGDWTAVDGLLGSTQARVREGACLGLAKVAEDAAQFETDTRSAAPWEVGPMRPRVAALVDDPSAPVRTAAKAAVEAGDGWAKWRPGSLRQLPNWG